MLAVVVLRSPPVHGTRVCWANADDGAPGYRTRRNGSVVSLQAPEAIGIAERITDRLIGRDSGRDSGRVDDETVREIVLDSMRRYRHLDHPASHVRALAAQLARDRIDALEWSEQPRRLKLPASFLFICAGNAGRSQIAAAVMRAIAPRATRTVSAGDHPAPRILPAVIDALDEIGVPAFGEYPKPLTPEFVAAAQHIVVLDCDDALELLNGRARLRWSIPLDSHSGKQAVRHMRDQIAEQVRRLARDVGLDVGPL